MDILIETLVKTKHNSIFKVMVKEGDEIKFRGVVDSKNYLKNLTELFTYLIDKIAEKADLGKGVGIDFYGQYRSNKSNPKKGKITLKTMIEFDDSFAGYEITQQPFNVNRPLKPSHIEATIYKFFNFVNNRPEFFAKFPNVEEINFITELEESDEDYPNEIRGDSVYIDSDNQLPEGGE